MAVEDPQAQQQPHPRVAALITAAQTGAVIRAAGAATVAPSVAVASPAVAAGKIVSGATEGLAHAVKIALVLRLLRRLMRRRRTESVSTLEAELRKRFPSLDPATIRRIVEQEIRYEDAFDRKATKRVEADMQKVALLDQEAQKKRIAEILAREKHYSVLRERAMWDRATGHGENEVVRQKSPLGAKWVLGAAKNHTLGCLALAGKNWPWSVLDTIPPPLHTGCQCSLQPLGPNDTVPPVGEAMSMARRAMALEEAIRDVADAGEVEAFLEGEEIRPSVARAICELREFSYEEALHPRGRGGRWIGKLGAKRIELKGEKKLTERQAHSAVKKVAEGVVHFYGGDKTAVEAHHEPQYMADVGGVARFRHPGELMAGINYGQGVMDNVRDPDFGVHDLRIVAHEAAHSLSGERPGPLPGFGQLVEEGAAEVLSLWFWHHRAQALDHRDAVHVNGKWTAPGADSLAHSVVYRDYVDELMRRTASKVGWDRTAMIDEIERLMRGDHNARIKFRDETDPNFPLPKDIPGHMGRTSGNEDATDHAPELVKWLISEPAKAPEGFDTSGLKTTQAKDAAAAAAAAIKEATHGLVPMKLTQLPEHDTATARSLPPGGVIAVHEDSAPKFQTTAIVHEYAHGIDRARNEDDWFTYTDAFKPLYDTLMASPTVKAIKADEVELLKGDDRMRAQLLQGRELFARAFEQYVAERSSNPQLRETLRKLQADPLLGFQQWQPDEFKAIAVEMEKALPKLYAELAARPKLQEAHWTEFLHPRGRRGQWVDAIQHHIPEREPESETHGGFTGEDFAKTLDGFTHGGITAVRQNRTKTQNLFGEVWLGLHKPGQSEPVGLARVTLKPPNNRGERVAELSNIYLTGAEQNKGFGRAFTDHLLKTLREGGVNRINVEAVSIGGYAWARRGFVWGDPAAEQRRILADAKADGRWERMQGHLPEAHYAEFERKLQAGEFSSEAELAAYGIDFPWHQAEPTPARSQIEGYVAPITEQTWLGKELLIGSRWKGSRPVTVTAST